MTVRVRIEPSPSGSIHVGNAYAALYNWLIRQKQGGAFILRIADTDQARVTEQGLRSALEDMRWLGLTWDEGPEVGGPHEPYFQSQRLELYKTASKQLLEDGHAYPCYCTPDELEERRRLALAEKRTPGYDGRCRDLTDEERRAFEAEGRAPALRFRVPDGQTRLDDLVRGEVVWDHAYIPDFVIQRADGTPLYQLAVSYDDMVMEMTHVIRADEHLSNTPKQLALIRAMGREPPRYGHIPLLVDGKRKKLGKRWGAVSVAAYREMGYLAEVLLNYLAILSWSPGDGVTERFTIPDLIRAFDLSSVTRNPSAFDVQKLTAFNAERIRELSHAEFVERVQPFLEGIQWEPDTLLKIAPLVQERVQTLAEVPSQVRFLFEEVEPDQKASALLEKSKTNLAAALQVLESVPEWTADTINAALMAWADGAGIKRKEAFQPLRAAVTGSLISPPLFESMELLGAARTLDRIRRAL